MSPLPLLLILLAAPGSAAEYIPPKPDGPACRRALDLLDKQAGRESWELASGLGYHVLMSGPDRGLYIMRERAGTASFTELPGYLRPQSDYNFEVRREDGTPVYAQFRFDGDRHAATIAGPRPIPESRLVGAVYDEATMKRLTRARFADAARTFTAAHARARRIDSENPRLPLEESGRVLSCPRIAWAAVINLCGEPEWSAITAAQTESYCQNHVCFGRDNPRRVVYEDTGRCERDPVSGKADRLDRYEPSR
jgi:hypothetical protein